MTEVIASFLAKKLNTNANYFRINENAYVGLVSLFNGMSTFVSYLMSNPSL